MSEVILFVGMPESVDFDPSRKFYRHAEVALILLSGLFAYASYFEFPCYPVFNEADHLIFAYEGWRMTGGEWIYRDFFEFTMPGTQVYYYLLFTIFGPAYWVIAATVVLIAMFSSWVLIKVSDKLIPKSLYLLPALIFVFFGFRWFGLDPSHRMFSPFILMSAVWVVLRSTELKSLIIAGALCALASFFTQQRGVAAAGGIAIFLLLNSISAGRDIGTTMRKIGTLAVSFVITLSLLCLPFIVMAGPGAFFGSTLGYVATNYPQAPFNGPGVYLIDFGKALADVSLTGRFALIPTFLYGALLPLVAFGVALAVLLKKKRWAERPAVLLIALVSVMLLIATPAPNPGRLYQVSMPLLILVTWKLGEVVASRGIRNRITSIVAICVISLAAAQAFRFQTNWDFIHWVTPTGTLAVIPSAQFERYRWIGERTVPGETVYDVAQPFIYFPLQLKNPTRYGQIWPYEYSPPEHVEAVVDDLTKDPPRYILWRNDYNRPDETRQSGDNTGPLADHVREHYAPVGPIYMIENTPVQVWEHKGSQK